ncbi:hypothetical protein HD806DRAFT_533003 [Xylariaceae sp. AK1471]|nr:hypothetical protein HD806DRAFT_533003 [Xylariaceae sp. AK1471]
MTDGLLMMHTVRQAPPMGPPPEVALSANPLAAIVAITAIMLVVVASKLWVRAIIIKKIALDDWSVLLGAGLQGSVADAVSLPSPPTLLTAYHTSARRN